MDNTLYAQIVHLAAIAGIIVLLAMNRIDVSTGLAFLAGLVGIALPSPFQPKSAADTPAAAPG